MLVQDIRLLDLLTNKHEDVIIHRLHPFIYDEANIDPKTVAARDNYEYTVRHADTSARR